jgi:hypothetical protein
LEDVARVEALTDGRGNEVAIDGVGSEARVKTLDCVKPFGAVVSVQPSERRTAVAGDAFGPDRSLSFARPSIMRPIGDLDTYRRALRTRRCHRRPSRARKRCDVGLVFARSLNGCGAYALRLLCRPPKSLVEDPFDRLPN